MDAILDFAFYTFLFLYMMANNARVKRIEKHLEQRGGS